MRKKTYVSHLGLVLCACMFAIPFVNIFCWIPLLLFRQDTPTYNGISAGQAIHNYLGRKTYVSKLGWYIFGAMMIIPFVNFFCWIPLLIFQQNEPPEWYGGEYSDDYGSYWDSSDSGE